MELLGRRQVPTNLRTNEYRLPPKEGDCSRTSSPGADSVRLIAFFDREKNEEKKTMSIYPDKKNGKLTGRWRVEVQRNGRVFKSRFATFADAQAWEAQVKNLVVLPAAVNDTVAALLGTVGAVKADHRRRANPQTLLEALEVSQEVLWGRKASRDGQVSSVKDAAAILGDPRLGQIDAQAGDKLVTAWRERGLDDKTLNRKFSALRCVLRWAVEREIIAKAPKLPWFDEHEGRIRSLTEAEERRMVALLVSYGRPLEAKLVQAAIDTGMRRGELLGVRGEQVIDGKVHLVGKETKSGRSRVISLTPRALAILEALKVARGDDRKTPLFFDVKEWTLRFWWDKARAEMGLADDPDFVVHACRHTCATRLVHKGIHIRTIQRFMGHEAIETTLKYTHVNDKLLDDAAAALATFSSEVPGDETAGGGMDSGGTPLHEAPKENE
jgi:integrase